MAQSSPSSSSSDDSFTSSSKYSSSASARGALSIDVPAYAPRQLPKSPSPQRTASDPITPSSRRLSDSIGVFSRSSTSQVPKSAGHKSSRSNRVKFGSTGSGEASPLSPSMSPTGRPDQEHKRRYSHEPKVNVYTECGRHGDDWLFGGFSVSETVKKLLHHPHEEKKK